MGYATYIVARAINSVLVIVVVLIITFVMFIGFADQQIYITTLQAVRQEVAHNPKITNKTEAIQKLLKERLDSVGYGKPWWQRLGTMLPKLVSFDFGNAWVQGYGEATNNVRLIILRRLPRTILLFGTSTILTILIGIYLGVKAAVRPGGILDKSTTITGLIGWSFAAWWVGMLLIYIFSYQLRLFPVGGMNSVPIPKDPVMYVLDVLWHMTLPVASLVVVSYGGWALITRNLLIGIFTEDYIMTARAKGLPERKVLYGHALKNAAPPIITMVSLALAGTFGGAIITEAVFSWPGMGQLYWQAIQNMDLPVIMGLLYINTLLLVAAILIADILYGFFDPRVKVGK